MKWNVLTKLKSQKGAKRAFSAQMRTNSKIKTDEEIINALLENRGIKTKKAQENFLHPPVLLSYSPADLLINSAQLKKVIFRIKLAIKNNEPVVVYGDYDADGICATAIMWEALDKLGANAMPFIPGREKEGYGLSIEGIKNINPKAKLIITVDSGIVAHEAVDYARQKNIDVIVLDHHEKPRTLPKAYAIVHTEKLCAAGIAYFVAKELATRTQNLEPSLEFAAIATITDLMPLLGVNRSIVKFGLEALNKTARPGLRALFEVAGIKEVGTYEVGYQIGPRINASGRIENALTALRLLCTKNISKARDLANLLNSTNRDRQSMVEEMTAHAMENQKSKIKNQKSDEKIIILEHESYHQGIIGLIAGKLVEKYYLPAIVIAKGETLSKASARSISGFNIIEAIRTTEKILVNAGGHPMAAGFTIETARIGEFESKIKKIAKAKISADMLERTLRIDVSIPLNFINFELYKLITQLAPFGLGNPEPVFASRGVVQSFRLVGADGKHLKLQLVPISYNKLPPLDAIAFNQGKLASKLKVGEEVNLAYSVSLDTFNGNRKLQLKIKDLKLTTG